MAGSLVGNYAGKQGLHYLQSGSTSPHADIEKNNDAHEKEGVPQKRTDNHPHRRPLTAHEKQEMAETNEKFLPDPRLDVSGASYELSEMNRTRMQRWNSGAHKTPRAGSATAELLKAAEIASSGESYSALDAASPIGKAVAYGAGAGLVLAALPEAIAGVAISSTVAALDSLGYASMASASIPISQGMLASETAAAAGGTAVLGGTSLAGRAYNRAATLFGRSGAESVANLGAHNVADALRLKTTLRLQEAGILDHAGQLTVSAIDRSVVVMNDGAIFKNQSVVSTLTRDGGHISDWQKLSTESVAMPAGQRIQVHFYRNKITGEVDYIHPDFKVKNPVNIFPKGRSQAEPTITPPYNRY